MESNIKDVGAGTKPAHFLFYFYSRKNRTQVTKNNDILIVSWKGDNMEELLIVLLIVYTVVNILLLIMYFALRKKRRCLGTLIINMSDPVKDVYRVALDDLQDLEREKIVFLKVQIEDNTQK